MTTQEKVIKRFQEFGEKAGLDVTVDGAFANTGWIRFSRPGSFNVDAAVHYDFQGDSAGFRVVGYGLPDPETMGALSKPPADGVQLIPTAYGVGVCRYDQTFEGNLRRIEDAVHEHVGALDAAQVWTPIRSERSVSA